MNRRRLLFVLSAAAALTTAPAVAYAADPVAPQTAIRAIDTDTTGRSAAVVVSDGPLVHTRQFLPVDESSSIVGANDPRRQLDHVLSQLDRTLALSNSGRARLVKLNIYIARDDLAEGVRQSLAALFKNEAKPALAFVSGKLPHPAALVALDAVALSSDANVLEPKFTPGAGERRSDSAVLPAGPKFYVSGQAERGKDLAEGTRLTMQSLGKTLAHLQLGFDRVVQVKAFLTPMSGVAEAEAEIAKFFPARVPPLVFVEWKSNLPTEIELIVAGKAAEGQRGPAIEFITPTGVQASPLYARVVRIDAPEIIYTAGLYGAAGDSAAEVQSLFDELGRVLEKTGSDFRHMAKATYYVSTDEASRRLNEVRPKLYDPARPPAASKITTPGAGRPGAAITLDMIAVKKP